MNKFRIVLRATTLAMITAIVFACSKDKETGTDQSNEEIVTVSKEDDMSAYLKQFKEKMQSDSKGNETLSMEDARWHLEAVLNYTYGDAGYQTTDIQCDTFYYELHANGIDVTLAQLNDAFMALSKEIENGYTMCYLPNKSVLAIHTLFENDSKDGDITVQNILTLRGYNNIQMWFDSTDYWNEWYYDYGWGYIEAGGKCGLYEGDCPESGAPLELTRKLNLRMQEHNCAYGSSYYTDVEQIRLNRHNYQRFYPYDDFVYDENSPCHYKIYYRCEDPHEPWASNPGGCICPEHMNYYLSKGMDLINHYTPIGKVCLGCYYMSNVLVGIDSKPDNCLHELYLNYGILHCDGTGGNDY